MMIEIKVPLLPESVADATVSTWHKKVGDQVKQGDNLVDLETDKVMLEVAASEDGILKEVFKVSGTTVQAEMVLAVMDTAAVATSMVATPSPVATTAENNSLPVADATLAASLTADDGSKNALLSPSARRVAAEHHVDVSTVQGTGKNGRITKENILAAVAAQKNPVLTGGDAPQNSEMLSTSPDAVDAISSGFDTSSSISSRTEKSVPMSRIRMRIAERLLTVKQQTAMLTTFNEVNMGPIMQIRHQYRDVFEKKHKVRLGFMSFFVRACVEALKRFPVVNASIDGANIVYHDYFDVGVAVSTDRGLVVPVLRDVDQMTMADIESSIVSYAEKAKTGKLTLEEMQGGNFTITNGGVFGSLLSTPILNLPQCAILGMHKIQERPVVENGQIVIRPMMYLALSYDHRLVDGKESVTFLVAIKELLEDPMRLLLEV